MTKAAIAKFFMIGTLVLWGVFDIWLYLAYGNAATESATTWRFGYLFPGIPFSVGSLMGHFFAQWRAPSPNAVDLPPWRMYGRYVFLALMGGWVALDVFGVVTGNSVTGVDNLVWACTFHQVWLVFLVGFGLGSVFLPMDDPTEFSS